MAGRLFAGVFHAADRRHGARQYAGHTFGDYDATFAHGHELFRDEFGRCRLAGRCFRDAAVGVAVFVR